MGIKSVYIFEVSIQLGYIKIAFLKPRIGCWGGGLLLGVQPLCCCLNDIYMASESNAVSFGIFSLSTLHAYLFKHLLGT